MNLAVLLRFLQYEALPRDKKEDASGTKSEFSVLEYLKNKNKYLYIC